MWLGSYSNHSPRFNTSKWARQVDSTLNITPGGSASKQTWKKIYLLFRIWAATNIRGGIRWVCIMRHSSWKLCVPWHKIACVFCTVQVWNKGSLRIFQVTKVNNVNGTTISTRNYSLDMCNPTFCKARVSQLTPLKNGCAFTCWKVEGGNENHSSINLSHYIYGTINRLSFHNPTLRIFSTTHARRIPLKILSHQSADLDHEQGTYRYEDDA